MTTETLMEADRYLLNNGFTQVGEPVELPNKQVQFAYRFGDLADKTPLGRPKTPHGISLTLHDLGDGRWTFVNFVVHSKDLSDKAHQTTQALSRLPGFQPHKI